MNKNENQYRNIMDKLDSIILYRKILEDDIIISFKKLISDLLNNRPFHSEYYEFMSKLVNVGEKYNLQGNVFKQYIIYLTLMDENLFSIYCDEKMKKTNATIVSLGSVT